MVSSCLINFPDPRSQGYDSIVFNPGDGNEVVIWDKHRVKSMRRSARTQHALTFRFYVL